jgi:hypothetical protein
MAHDYKDYSIQNSDCSEILYWVTADSLEDARTKARNLFPSANNVTVTKRLYVNTILLIGSQIRVDANYEDRERLIAVGVHEEFPEVPKGAVFKDVTEAAYPFGQINWGKPVAKRAIAVYL